MLEGRGTGDQQDVGRAVKQPGERDLHWSSFERRRSRIKRRRLQRSEASQREERHISNALTRKVVDKAVVRPVRNVVEVLHADDLGNRLPLRQLSGTDVAQTQMANQSLTLQLCKHSQRFCD